MFGKTELGGVDDHFNSILNVFRYSVFGIVFFHSLFKYLDISTELPFGHGLESYYPVFYHYSCVADSPDYEELEEQSRSILKQLLSNCSTRI